MPTKPDDHSNQPPPGVTTRADLTGEVKADPAKTVTLVAPSGTKVTTYDTNVDQLLEAGFRRR
jgi:hypothetical protein